MTNAEVRRNDEIRMAKRKLLIANLSFEHSGLLRHSSFVLRHLVDLPSNFASKERIVFFLLAYCCHRAVSRANDRVVGQRQDFLEIIL